MKLTPILGVAAPPTNEACSSGKGAGDAWETSRGAAYSPLVSFSVCEIQRMRSCPSLFVKFRGRDLLVQNEGDNGWRQEGLRRPPV
jgi:hypothetical protein